VARVYVGPWGGCYIVFMPGGSAQECTSSPAFLAQSARTPAIYTGGAASNVALGSVTSRVARVVITLSGGRTETVRLVRVDGQRFWAFGASQPVRWTAYDAAGHAVAHGTT